MVRKLRFKHFASGSSVCKLQLSLFRIKQSVLLHKAKRINAKQIVHVDLDENKIPNPSQASSFVLFPTHPSPKAQSSEVSQPLLSTIVSTTKSVVVTFQEPLPLPPPLRPPSPCVQVYQTRTRSGWLSTAGTPSLKARSNKRTHASGVAPVVTSMVEPRSDETP